MVLLIALTVLSALWSWDAIKIAIQGDFNEYSRLVRSGMDDSFRQPVVSASEGVFVLPEIDIALPYEDSFYNLRYNAYTENGFQEASFTTSDIIVASTQPKGMGDASAFDMPHFYCSRVVTVTNQEVSDYGKQLDEVSLNDGRTLYVYANERQGTDCSAVFNETGVDEFLYLLKKPAPTRFSFPLFSYSGVSRVGPYQKTIV